ncbi:MAG TPA: diguanylate cyclase [Thermoanaerobaculia bacterium]|jgi:diguanylate cyclase (GGDEF)-like protein|nr:diguanylate cyclase [Thermoanaerobaculia bacterium]
MSLRRAALIVLLAAVPAAARVLPAGIRPFRTYGTEAGLGNLAAMRLAQDTAGFLWVATQDGVYRYDGNRFARFGLAEGLPSSYVANVQAAPDGSVWAITYGGLARFDGRRFNAITAPQPNAMSIDDANNVWIATARGVFRGAAKQPFAAIAGWPNEEATAVWFDKPLHATWTASADHIGRFANGAWTFWPNPGNERIDAIVVDRQHTIWARSAAHLWSKAETEPAFHDESRALPATSTSGYLDIDRRGNLWVPTDRGVATHDDSGWSVIGAAEGLPIEWARDVLEDREGSIWIASLSVHRMLGRGELTTYDRRSGLPNAVIWCFLWDHAGRLLVGTDLGLARSTPTGWETVLGTAGHQIRSVIEEGDGTLWMAGSPAEVLRVGGDVRAYPVAGRTVLKLVRDNDGALWAATRGGGLLRKAPNEDRFACVAVRNGTSDETFRWLMIDSRGRLWAAGEHGIACLDRGTWRRYTMRDGLAHNHAAYIVETASGDFLATYFEPLGMVRFSIDDGAAMHVIDHLDASRGLSSSKIFLVGEDAHRRLWVGTGVGVDLVNGPLIEHLGMADGLAGDDIDAMAFLAQPNGEVFLGTSSGFSHYIPRLDAPRVEPPPVRITSSAIGAKHDFSASFAALTYLKQDLIEYQVRLVGLEDDWRPAVSRDVRYAMLAPAQYRFEARARLRPGTWSAPVSVPFTIAPAWWQTSWARGLMILAILALIVLAHRTRVALLRRRNRELEALVAQRTHELADVNTRLMDLSVTDALTGMKNRRYLDLCMTEYMADALRRHESLSRMGVDPTRENADLLFFLLDLDRFKEINDRFGHAAGDRVLVDIHELLKTTMRDTDTLVRWGGEEFLLVARNSSRHEAAAIAERIRGAIAGHAFIVGRRTTSLRLTCSIGFAAFPFLPLDRTRFGWQEVLDVADTCLYAAKHAGRNRTVGVIAGDSRDPETLVQRIRQSLDEVVASGEVTLATNGDATAIAV